MKYTALAWSITYKTSQVVTSNHHFLTSKNQLKWKQYHMKSKNQTKMFVSLDNPSKKTVGYSILEKSSSYQSHLYCQSFLVIINSNMYFKWSFLITNWFSKHGQITKFFNSITSIGNQLPDKNLLFPKHIHTSIEQKHSNFHVKWYVLKCQQNCHSRIVWGVRSII